MISRLIRAKYFIVLPGQFEVTASRSSPSNTPPPFDRGAFPPIHVADDVIAQHRLSLTQHFGITELQLVPRLVDRSDADL